MNQKIINLKHEKLETNLEEKKVKETKKIEEKINELELSTTLDDKLERFDIERMKDKTKNVVKRMTFGGCKQG